MPPIVTIMKILLKKTAVAMLLLGIAGGGLLCLLSAEKAMSHESGMGALQDAGIHIAYANSLSRGLVAAASMALASFFALAFFHILTAGYASPKLPELSYSRQKWREPPGIIQRCYSWLSLLVRSPGAMNTA